jgi:DNA-binding MarR family transcriptional regulator
VDRNANDNDREGADARNLGDQVRAAVGLVYRRFRSERPAGTLGDAALDVLTHLHKHGSYTLTELSEYGRVAPASMSQSVNRLVSAGYVVRSPDATDRRKVRFSTTHIGAAIAEETSTKRNDWLEARLDALNAEDRATIARASELLRVIAQS